MTDFDEKLKQLKEESIAEFSMSAKTLDQVIELLESAKRNSIAWFSGESVEPSGDMFELIKNKMKMYPEKRQVFISEVGARKDIGKPSVHGNTDNVLGTTIKAT